MKFGKDFLTMQINIFEWFLMNCCIVTGCSESVIVYLGTFSYDAYSKLTLKLNTSLCVRNITSA